MPKHRGSWMDGKYIQENLDGRIPADKGARLVSYSKGAGRMKVTGFGWNSPRSWLWRKKLAQVADKCGIVEYEEFKEKFGSHWAWSIQKRVISEELSEYPTGAIARADGVCVPYDSTQITVGRSSKSEGFWEESLDEWLALCQKELAFSRLKREREIFTSESEAEFDRRAAESAREAAIYPPAVPETESEETRHPEFDEVLATFPPETPF